MSMRPQDKAARKRTGDSAPARLNKLAQAKCACGGPAGMSGQCDECQKKALSTGSEGATSANVQDGLASPGKPLDEQTRHLMEAGLGHDFSNVRVHVDERADAAARALGANAYTVGDEIAFASGKYDPKTPDGRQRIAHELTHVVQQRLHRTSNTSTTHESEAHNAGAHVAAGKSVTVGHAAPAGAVQFDKAKDDNALDEKAKKILAITADTTLTKEKQAVAVVNAIIDAYYSADKHLVDSVIFDEAKAGDGVHAEEKFSKTSKNAESTGIISVGSKFLEKTTERHFARRVLQVGHEIEHIHQWREGLAGGQNAKEREFLAFYHEATNPEKSGTGRMVPSSRLGLIHAALDNYVCMNADQQKSHASEQKELLTKRTEIISAGTKAEKEVPTTCAK